jgi:hypothetical protein
MLNGLRTLTTTGKLLNYNDVAHVGRAIDKNDSGRLRQANVSPA